MKPVKRSNDSDTKEKCSKKPKLTVDLTVNLEACQPPYPFGNDHSYKHPKTQVRYFVDSDPLGEGVYGKVYRGQEMGTVHVVAIKVSTVNRASDTFDFAKEAFEREKDVLTLGLESTPKLIDWEVRELEHFVQCFLVMEYFPTSLYAWIREKGPLRSLQSVKHLIKDLLTCVAELHQQGFIHRDLKPANILLKPANILFSSDCELVLADFGLSRTLQKDTPMTPTTCSMWYRAPELLRKEEYGFKIDIWSVGCIFTAILDRHCSPIFQSYTEPAMLKEQSNGLKSHCLNVYQDRLGKDGVDLLKKLLAFNPQNRPTAEEALGHAFFANVK